MLDHHLPGRKWWEYALSSLVLHGRRLDHRLADDSAGRRTRGDVRTRQRNGCGIGTRQRGRERRSCRGRVRPVGLVEHPGQ